LGVITNRQVVLSRGSPIAILVNMTRSLAALRNLSRVRVADARKARADGAAARARTADCRLKADKALDSALATQNSGSLRNSACQYGDEFREAQRGCATTLQLRTTTPSPDDQVVRRSSIPKSRAGHGEVSDPS
jgi:hypothetical protein